MEQTVFGSEFNNALTAALKGRKTFDETLNMPELASATSDINESWEKEKDSAPITTCLQTSEFRFLRGVLAWLQPVHLVKGVRRPVRSATSLAMESRCFGSGSDLRRGLVQGPPGPFMQFPSVKTPL
eukprot:13273192-Alexandrium_andersonii.AAC.1